MIAIFPDKEMQLNFYSMCIDDKGEATLDAGYFRNYSQKSRSTRNKRKQI